MTKSATRVAADKVTFTQTEVTSAVALKAPIASPVFTGNVGIGVAPDGGLSTNRTLVQLGGNSMLGSKTAQGANSDFFVGNNVKLTATGDKYISTDEASNYYQTDGKHLFYVAPSGSADAAISWTTAMTIKNDGYIITPAAVSGGWSVQDDGDAPYFTTFAGSASYRNHFFFKNTNGLVGKISTSGSATTYGTSSDYRLKTDVQPMTGAADRVKLLKPCNFEWIVDGTRVDGFIAHEAQEVVPEAVTGTKDAMRDEEYEVTAATDTEAAVMGTRSVPDMQGIDQAKLVPLLTATIQELIARIEALEGE